MGSWTPRSESNKLLKYWKETSQIYVDVAEPDRGRATGPAGFKLGGFGGGVLQTVKEG